MTLSLLAVGDVPRVAGGASRVARGLSRTRGRGRGRGRHVREQRLVRVGTALAAADITVADDLIVLQALRSTPLGDLDLAQICARSALPPSAVRVCLDRLVRTGLAREAPVAGRARYGLS